MRPARPELKRFVKFSVVGGIGAVVDFGTFNLLISAVGLSELPASVVSFLAAVSSNFVWNRYWTYPDSRSKSIRRQAAQFGVVSAIGLALRTPLLALLLRPGAEVASRVLEVFPRIPLEPPTLGANLALAAAVVVVLFWNFFINRVWTYGDVGPTPRRLDSATDGNRPL